MTPPFPTLRSSDLGARATLRNSIGYSPHKGTLSLGYNNGPFNWSWQWLYYGKTKIDPDSPDSTYEFPRVPATSFFNTTVGFDVNEHFTWRLIVNNVFHKGPPSPVPAAGGSSEGRRVGNEGAGPCSIGGWR